MSAGDSDQGRSVRIAAVALGVAAVIGLGIYGWFEYLEDRVLPKRWGTVVEGRIYRSGQLHPALLEETLREHGIGRVVALRHFKPHVPLHVSQQEILADMGMPAIEFDMKGDGRGNPDDYVEVLATMIDSGAGGPPVLVHCMAGTMRTGAAVAWYRLLVEGWSAQEAVDEMAAYDWDPTDAQPLEFMNANMDHVATALVERGLIERTPDPLPVLRRP